MGFFWKCPCGSKNFYRGGLTTEAVTTCSACSLKLRIWKHRIVAKPQDNHDKPQKIKYNGHVEILINALWRAITTIHNKPEVKEYKRLIKNRKIVPFDLRHRRYVSDYADFKQTLEYYQALKEEKNK